MKKTNWEAGLEKLKQESKTKSKWHTFSIGTDDEKIAKWIDAKKKQYSCSASAIIKQVLYSAIENSDES